MLTAGLVLAGLAALLHVWIFWIESIVFETKGRRIFGVPAEHVPVARQWAYNQGFYNLFLAIITAAGVVVSFDQEGTGKALVVAGTGSMLAAALVLVTNDRSKARGAVVQGTLPALALLALLAHCVS